MIEIIRDSSLSIPKKDNNKLCENIKNNLTRNMKNYNNSLIKTVCFYREDNEFLYIPRFYPIEHMIGCCIINKLYDGININIESNIKLKDNLQLKAFNYMTSHNNGIICLDTGSGKTIISIKTISEIKKKTLILLHRINLIDQWIDKIEKFTNVKLNKDMIILKSNNIKKTSDASIILTTVQTMKSLIERYNNFISILKELRLGLLIVDEVHSIIGPEKFSDVSLIIPVKRVFGLSATPYRNDGTSDVIQHHLGPIYKPEDKSEIIMDAEVTMIFFDSGLLPRSKKYIYWGGDFQRARYLNLLKNTKLINICLGLLNKFKQNRNVFLIAERIKFIEELYNKFDYENKSKFIKNDTNKNLKKQIVLATPGKLKEGMDEPKKDALILTSPIGNIQQACGRVLRTNPGKKIPIIIDLIDFNCFDIFKTFYYRLKFYRSKNWNIKFLKIDNNGIIPIEEKDIKELKEENK